MKYIVFDIESDGLLEKVSKIYVLSYEKYEKGKLLEKNSLFDRESIIKFIEENKDYYFVGHNIIKYDLPVIKKIFKYEVKNKIIDTLGISYYLHSEGKFLHGLEKYGERFGIKKPKIEDWINLSLEEYQHRCEEDVKINVKLFHTQLNYLVKLYDANFDKIFDIISYLNFKLESLRNQEEQGIPLDKVLAKKTYLELEYLLELQKYELAKHMPRNVVKTIPSKIYKKDGSLSETGKKWFQLLQDLDLPKDSTKITELGNPLSHVQLKKWLFELGWEPITFKENDKGEKIPQITQINSSELCPSIDLLIKDYPYIKNLKGLYRIRHRLGIVKGFLESVDEKGKIYSTAHGFSSTIRLKHSKPIVNLPKPSKFYGDKIRGCLTVPDESYTMIGADISGLEDNTKQHYIYYYDADYVNQMRVPGFDPHIDIAVLAGFFTSEEAQKYKELKKKPFLDDEEEAFVKRIAKLRSSAKVVNFSATYGAGPPKIAQTLKRSLQEAKALHRTYWNRNWAIKKVAQDVKKKRIGNKLWLLNPVSGYWIRLRKEKDAFSALNQNTGVFVFDNWLRFSKLELDKLDIKIPYQYHDRPNKLSCINLVNCWELLLLS